MMLAPPRPLFDARRDITLRLRCCRYCLRRHAVMITILLLSAATLFTLSHYVTLRRYTIDIADDTHIMTLLRALTLLHIAILLPHYV